MRISLVGLLGVVAFCGAAAAASNVTNKYDGVYTGTAQPAPGTEVKGCLMFSVGDVTIARGFLRTPKGADLPFVTGLITEEGYVAAFMARPGHARAAMDGRFDEDQIVAGFIEEDSGCVWVVHLAPVRNGDLIPPGYKATE